MVCPGAARRSVFHGRPALDRAARGRRKSAARGRISFTQRQQSGRVQRRCERLILTPVLSMTNPMSEGGLIELSREIDAIQIPSGNKITLPGGTAVIINQALGGSYTVLVPHQAGLFRIAGNDADALGKEVVAQTTGEGPFELEKVWEQLRNCYDP